VVVAVDEVEAVGLVGVADESVGAVGFEHLVVMGADGGELGRVVGVAVGADGVGVVDLEAAGGFAARHAAGAVAAADLALDVDGQRAAGLLGGAGTAGVVDATFADLVVLTVVIMTRGCDTQPPRTTEILWGELPLFRTPQSSNAARSRVTTSGSTPIELA
jgi:hypothetical protein